MAKKRKKRGGCLGSMAKAVRKPRPGREKSRTSGGAEIKPPPGPKPR